MDQLVLKYRNGQATILAINSTNPRGGAQHEPGETGMLQGLCNLFSTGMEYTMCPAYLIGPSRSDSFAVLIGLIQSFHPARSIRLDRPPP